MINVAFRVVFLPPLGHQATLPAGTYSAEFEDFDRIEGVLYLRLTDAVFFGDTPSEDPREDA